jgi:hypothetical protein
VADDDMGAEMSAAVQAEIAALKVQTNKLQSACAKANEALQQINVRLERLLGHTGDPQREND